MAAKGRKGQMVGGINGGPLVGKVGSQRRRGHTETSGGDKSHRRRIKERRKRWEVTQQIAITKSGDSINHPWSKGNFNIVQATSTRKLPSHFFVNIRRRVSTMSSRFSHSAVPVTQPVHFHFHITTSTLLARATFSAPYHPVSLFFHLICFTPICLHPAITCSFISHLPPPHPSPPEL